MARPERWQWLAIVPFLASGCAERIMAPVYDRVLAHVEPEMHEALVVHAIGCLIAQGLSAYPAEHLLALEGRTLGLMEFGGVADSSPDVSLMGWGLPGEHIVYDSPQLGITPQEAASRLAESSDELRSISPSGRPYRYSYYFSTDQSRDVLVLQATSRINADGVVEMRIERAYRLGTDRITWK